MLPSKNVHDGKAACYRNLSLSWQQVEEDEELHRQSMEDSANAKADKSERLPGTEGAFAISAVGTPPEPLKFGTVEVTDAGDGAAIRAKFANRH